MVHGGVRVFFHVLGGLGLILLLAVAVLTWRLAQGPLRLDALTPYLAEALVLPDSDYRVVLGSTDLLWESFDRPLDLRVADVRALDGNGDVVAAVPELALTIAPSALLRGEIRLRSVDILDPHLHLVRDTDGALRLGLWYGPHTPSTPRAPDTPDATALLRDVVAGLTGRVGLGPAQDLMAVRVAGARATVMDERLNAVWNIPEVAVELYRNDHGSVGLSASLELALPGGDGETTHLDAVGDYDPDAARIDLGIGFAALRPAALAPVADALAPLAAVDLPLDGTLTLTFGVTHTLTLQAAGLSATAGPGHLRLPAPVNVDYAVEDMRFAGSVAAGLDHLQLDELRLSIRPPGDEAGPVDLGTDAAAVPASPPAVVTATGTVGEGAGPEGGFAGDLVIGVAGVPVDALGTWWPPSVAPKPRDWVVNNLKGGNVVDGRWTIGLAGPVIDALAPTDVDGQARVEATSVRYIKEMPPVEAADADIRFQSDQLDIAVSAGRLYGLRITGGDIVLSELDHPTTPRADIDLTITGPLADALRVVDHPPLAYASKLGVEPTTATGRAETRLRMAFPLIADLRLDQLEVLATAESADAALRGVVFGRDLSQGRLSLSVDTESLEASGQALIAGVPAGFAWREVFSGKPFRSRYAVRAVVAEDKRSVFGLDFPPFTPAFLRGPANVDLEYTVFDDSLSTLGAQIDLIDTAMRLPGFDWTKPPGQPAQATVALRMADGVVRDVSRFSVRSGDAFLAEGRVRLADGGSLDTITLSRLTIGETVLAGTIEARHDGSFGVDVRGPAFDATPFLRGGKAKGESAGEAWRTATAAQEDADGTATDLPPVDLKAAFDVVWLSEDGTLENVTAQLRRDNGTMRHAQVRGQLEGQAPLTFILGRDPGAADRQFTARTEDAGALLRAIGLIGTLRGGMLDLNGRLLDSGRAEGVLEIADYRLVDAPVLARILSVAALTGILEALTGEGLAFTSMQAPFIYADSLLTVKDFRTSGPSLGLTGDGTVNLETDELAVRGTIVPAYALNSLLGRLPLVGGLLSGFEEGGGLFAATYTVDGPLHDPRVAVNPLSALAPGFLRGLFQDFGAAPEDADAAR